MSSNAVVSRNEELKKIKRPTVSINTPIYPSLEVNISIDNSNTWLVHYKRLYEIQNIFDEPIYEVIHGIATDVEKTFDDLNVKVYDEEDKPLRISAIPIDKPFQKEFTTIFNKPITRSDKERRYYVLEYDVEEKGKYFENYFGTNCGRFVVTIEYPSHLSPPVAYEVNLETDEMVKCRVQPTIESVKKVSTSNGKRNIARWVKRNIVQGQSFRFEWK
jgi:hypothetical protein